jgi:hypothetical protein
MTEQTILNAEQEAFLSKQEKLRRFTDAVNKQDNCFKGYLAESEKQTQAFAEYMAQLTVANTAWAAYQSAQEDVKQASNELDTASSNWNLLRKH